MLKHVAGLRETAGVPGEIPFAIGMLNVQPDDIARQVVIIEALIHFQNISLIPIVPAALVVAEGEERGQCLGPCRFGVGGDGVTAGSGSTWSQWRCPEIQGDTRGQGQRTGRGTGLLKMHSHPSQGDKDQESRLHAVRGATYL